MISLVSFTGVKSKTNFNSKKFYNEHPDLAPRNIYLSMGRTIDTKKVNRTIENFGEPFWVRAKNWFKYKIEDIFKIRRKLWQTEKLL